MLFLNYILKYIQQYPFMGRCRTTNFAILSLRHANSIDALSTHFDSTIFKFCLYSVAHNYFVDITVNQIHTYQ